MNLLEKYSSVLENIKNDKSVETIFIFGSYAKNNVKPLSDLDVAIIFKKYTPKEKKIEILSNSNEELDLNDFFSLPLTIQYKIIREGIVYYNSNKNLTRLKLSIIFEYNDFKYILNKIYTKKNQIPII
jgi:predicted nucleotidyltransferase